MKEGVRAAVGSKGKVPAGLLALFLGGLGIHKFYLGHVGAGIVHSILFITIIGIPVNCVVCLIEAIIYFTKEPLNKSLSPVEGLLHDSFWDCVGVGWQL